MSVLSMCVISAFPVPCQHQNSFGSSPHPPPPLINSIIFVTLSACSWNDAQKHGNSEKADYLQIGGSNINIYSKNKGLCLGAGALTIVGAEGGITNIFVINLGGRDFFFPVGLGSRKIFWFFCTSHENVTAAPPPPQRHPPSPPLTSMNDNRSCDVKRKQRHG